MSKQRIPRKIKKADKKFWEKAWKYEQKKRAIGEFNNSADLTSAIVGIVESDKNILSKLELRLGMKGGNIYDSSSLIKAIKENKEAFFKAESKQIGKLKIQS